MRSLAYILLAILAGCGSATESTAPEASDAEIAAMKFAKIEWDNAWQGRCSQHRLDWLAPGVEYGLLDDFAQRLGRRELANYERFNDTRKFCGTDERWGQTCDVNVKRKALHEIGKLADFADFACKRMVCTEQSVCDKP